MALKEKLLEAVPCLLKQSSKTKIIVNLVPKDFQLPQENESSQLCSGQKVDGQQCRHKVAELKFMPQTKSKDLTLDFAYRRATYIGETVLRYDMSMQSCKEIFFLMKL